MNQRETDAPVNSRPWWDDYFQSNWDSYGGSDQTRYFMQTLLSHLPEPELAYMRAGSRTILDWGCAFGEGVATLAQTFPHSSVAGLDFSQTAIEQARVRNAGHEYIWSAEGEILRAFDLIVTSNCLEHFESPLAVVEKHLASCSSLYIVLVPYNECPLHPQHRAQFRVESFPQRIRDFKRIHAEPLVVDKYFWPGQQLLVVYANDNYLREAEDRADSMALAIARLDAARIAELQRAEAAEAGREAERQRADAAETTLQTERQQWDLLLQTERQQSDLLLRTERQQWELLLRTEQEKARAERAAAKALRVRSKKGILEFQTRFEEQISLYRAERAWRIMLAIRKAYTLLVRRKLRGIRPFIGWSLGSALGRNTELDGFEPILPNILDFAPRELLAPEPEKVAASKSRARAQEPNADCRYDVVVLPIFDFDFRFQRPQQIAMQFARDGHRVFWISPSRMLPGASPQPYELIKIRENIWETHLCAAPFDLYRGTLEPSQATALMEGLRRLYHDLDLAASCVILQFPFWRQIGLGLRENFGARIVYDCMDDWQNWPTEPLPGAFSLSEETKLVRESDVLVVTSRRLRDRHAADHIESQFIPNAADFEFFRDAPVSSLLSDFLRPVVGYYGAIADWFDLELIAEVARSRPQYSFVLIGQVHLADISALTALPNVHLLGEKQYGVLPAYLGRFDVCTLPFRMNRLTEAVDPVKVYEYLSQGKPVVSVPLPELEPLSKLLYFASGPEEFSAQIDRALAENDAALRRNRIAFASENTWRSRFETLDAAIRAKFPLVSLLVVTYNTREYLQPFLDSVRRNTSYPSYEVIVVDNDSSDGSAADLQRYAKADPRVRVECLQENLGFAGGNNFAARMAKGEYLVLLNPDTVVTAGWLERLLRPLETDPAIGLVAPVTNFSGNETKVDADYRTRAEMEDFADWCAQVKRGESFALDVIPLFCGLLRRAVWDEIGGLDEGFKVGTFEDDDFSLRVRKAGYRIVAAEDCFIHHFGNGSFGKLKSEAFLRIFDQNKERFESKWKVKWRPHQTRAGVRPVSADNRVTLAEFIEGDGPAG